MHAIRILPALLAIAAWAAAGDGAGTEAQPPKAPPKVKRALNRAYKGRILKIKKKRVTLFYDFEDPAQLQDFEEARPPRLLDAGRNQVRIAGGRLILEGSSAIRHRMEGKGELRARFMARVSEQRNVGTVFTEPVLSDFYIVLNFFDQRFYKNGGLILAACGLHEDEGADTDMSLVNWRDIFKSDVRKQMPVGRDVEVEVYKDGWTEYCRVGDVEGKGSSKGKCKEMKTYQFGFWVHNSRASFDDLTLSIELTDEFLDLNDLTAEVDVDWEDVPETGPLAGIHGVPPQVRSAVEAYAAGGGAAREMVRILAREGLGRKIREITGKLLAARKDPKAVPLVIDGLYAPDKLTRKLSIDVVKAVTGKTFGFSPTGREKSRSKAIQKLNAYLAKNRARFFG